MRYPIAFKVKTIIKNSYSREISAKVLKFIHLNHQYPLAYRQKALLLQSSYSKKYNFNRSFNYCLETGKTRFILKNLKISRMSLKKFASS